MKTTINNSKLVMNFLQSLTLEGKNIWFKCVKMYHTLINGLINCLSLQVHYNYRLLESPCRFKTEKDRNAEHCQPMLTLNVTKALLFCFQNNSFTHIQKLFWNTWLNFIKALKDK